MQAAGRDSFDALMGAQSDIDLHKAGLADWRQRIQLTVPLGGRPCTLFLKRYRRPPMDQQVNQRLAGWRDTAAMEWHWLTRLSELGIGAPVPVAYGARRSCLREQASLVITAAVPGVSLEKWVPAQIDSTLADRAFKNKLSGALANLISKLHGRRLIHRDLYLAHVFLDTTDLDSPTLTLIDLQRMIRPRLRWQRWVVKDLLALNYSTPVDAASTTDRVRWFKLYGGITRLSDADKKLIRAIAGKTRRVARHDANRNARLSDV